MNVKFKPLFSSFIAAPKKIWVYGVFPFIVLVLLCCLLFGDCSVFTPDQKGYSLFLRQSFNDAAETFVDSQWQAVSLYRDGDFEGAAAILAGFDTAEGTFNLGNSLVMLGKYEEAINRYERALELKPGWQEAENNLEIAAKRAARLKQEGGNMTGGKLEADEIVFTQGKSSDGSEEVSEDPSQMSDAEMRAVWLRNVQTKPADFLRAKFAYQQSATNNSRKEETSTD